MKIHHITLMLTFFVLASCGNSKKEEKQKDESFKINKNVETENQKDDGVTEIILTGNDQMRFNLKEIKVNAGDEVKLTLNMSVNWRSSYGAQFCTFKTWCKNQ